MSRTWRFGLGGHLGARGSTSTTAICVSGSASSSPPVDTWWSLDDPEGAASTASRALRDHGLVWLDRLGTDQEIIEMYDREGRVKVGLGPRAALDIGLLELETGAAARGEARIRDYLATDMSDGHRQFVVELLRNQGLGYLLP